MYEIFFLYLSIERITRKLCELKHSIALGLVNKTKTKKFVFSFTMSEYPNDLLAQYKLTANKLRKIQRVVFK